MYQRLIFFLILFFSCNTQTKKKVEEPAFYASACNDDVCIVAGNEGRLFKNRTSSITWEELSVPTKKDLLDAFYDGESFYVAGHEGTVLKSSDNGSSWNILNAPSSNHFFAIASNKKKIVGVGQGRRGKIVLVKDDDESTWKSIYSQGARHTSFYDIAFGATLWVAVGDYGAILLIDDTTNAIKEVFINTSKKFKSVASDANNNRWVVVGHEGAIYVSDDSGITWHEKSSGTTENLLSIAFNGKRFLCVGSGGVVLTSKDGSSWHKASLNINSTFRSVSCTKTKWLILTIEGNKKIIDDSQLE